MKLTLAFSFLPLLVQSAPDVDPRATKPLCKITARVDCQSTPHTSSNPSYRLNAGDYVFTGRHAAGEKVQHNGVVNG